MIKKCNYGAQNYNKEIEIGCAESFYFRFGVSTERSGCEWNSFRLYSPYFLIIYLKASHKKSRPIPERLSLFAMKNVIA